MAGRAYGVISFPSFDSTITVYPCSRQSLQSWRKRQSEVQLSMAMESSLFLP